MPGIVVAISAHAEWRALRSYLDGADKVASTPYGETFIGRVDGVSVRYFFEGWGKVAAAAATQYAIQTWQPELLVNLGTCGGFAGRIAEGDIVLADRTIIYDIVEQMNDPAEAIADYATDIDVSWLAEPSWPAGLQCGLLLSADRDILREEVAGLIRTYDGTAADWESGAIAWVAARHQMPVVILRGVTDVVGAANAPAYDAAGLFEQRSESVIQNLLGYMPWLLGQWRRHSS